MRLLAVVVVSAALLASSGAVGASPSNAAAPEFEIAYRTFEGTFEKPRVSIWLAGADGRTRKRLATFRYASAPAWQDADTLAYVFFPPRARQRLVSVQLTKAGRVVSVRWEETACRSQLTFARNGRYACLDSGDEPDIWAYSSRSEILAHLYDDGAGDTPKDHPAISPDGRILALADFNSLALWDIDRQQPLPLRRTFCCPAHLAWSPDGTSLAFTRICKEYTPCGLWIVNRDGTRPRRVTTWGQRPAWSPDGRRLVFDGIPRKGLGRAIYTVRTDGTDLVRISAGVFHSDRELGQVWRPR